MSAKQSEILDAALRERVSSSVADAQTQRTPDVYGMPVLTDPSSFTAWHGDFEGAKQDDRTQTPVFPANAKWRVGAYRAYAPAAVKTEIDAHLFGAGGAGVAIATISDGNVDVKMLPLGQTPSGKNVRIFAQGSVNRVFGLEAAGVRDSITYFDLSSTDVNEDLKSSISPFDSIDDKSSISAQEEIDKILLLRRPDAKTIHVRLTSLFEYSQVEPEMRVMSPESVKSFRSFLQANQKISTPSIFLQDSGAIRSQWTVDHRKALSILFHASGSADYVLFAPDRRRPTLTVDLAGTASWQTVMSSLEKVAILDWLYRD